MNAPVCLSPHVEAFVHGTAASAGPLLVAGAEFAKWPLCTPAFRTSKCVGAAGRAGLAGRDRGLCPLGFEHRKARFQIRNPLGKGAQVLPDRDLIEDLQNV